MGTVSIDPRTIVDFWREAGPERWFGKEDAFDETIRQRFGEVYAQAVRGELDAWRDDPTGALALVILLDQFPRNMFRDTPRAFAMDEQALAIARQALARGDHRLVGEDVNQFFAMPMMHSERLADQDACVEWMRRIGDESNLAFAMEHRDIVARFGRFPHRNVILGRESSQAERRFLADGGFAG